MTSPETRIVAVLHDVVEDSPEHDKWTFERLREAGFSEQVVEAVDCVTSRADEPYEDFIARCSRNEIAREVKLGDLEDNMNLLRISDVSGKDLDRLAKYHRSWKFLANIHHPDPHKG